jgi:hypothetical protein
MSTLLRLSLRRSLHRLPRATATATATATPSQSADAHGIETQLRRWFSKEIEDSSSVSGPSPLLERSDKSFLSRLYEKHSLRQQTDRILVAESLLQAASTQASDP